MPVNLLNAFDANFYRASNSDLHSYNDAQALSHFQNYGLNEGRAFSPFVDLNFYRSSNPDLAGFNNSQAFEHLQNYGVDEGRQFSPFVDLNFYRASNADLAGLNNSTLFEHFVAYGVDEGRQFSPFVDLDFYLSNNPDVAQAFEGNRLQALEHLELYGLDEGRALSESFNVNYYLANNSDLKAAGLDNEQAYEHFVLYGIHEARPASDYSRSSADLSGSVFDSVFSSITSLQAGSSFTLPYEVQNTRTGNANEFQLSFYLSKDSTIDPGDRLLDSSTISGLAGKSIIENSKLLFLPETSDPFWSGEGTYYIGMIVDSTNAIKEVNEINNANVGLGVDYKGFQINPTPTVDLLASFLDFQTPTISLNSGSNFDVQYTVENSGNTSAGGFQVGFYLSSDSTIDTSDRLLGNSTYESLIPNSFFPRVQNLRLPSADDSFWNSNSTYYIGMVVDDIDAISEVNEGNNTSNLSILINKLGSSS